MSKVPCSNCFCLDLRFLFGFGVSVLCLFFFRVNICGVKIFCRAYFYFLFHLLLFFSVSSITKLLLFAGQKIYNEVTLNLLRPSSIEKLIPEEGPRLLFEHHLEEYRRKVCRPINTQAI